MNSKLYSYDKLSTSDVREFDNSLKQWCKENDEKNVLMMFDKSSLKVISNELLHHSGRSAMDGMIIKCSDSYHFKMSTEGLIIEWNNYVGEISILNKITAKDTREILYQIPENIESCILFYAY